MIAKTSWEGGEINMFMGEYSHTIDAKSRLIIPSKFREKLGDTFVISKGLDGCLFAYSNEDWAEFENKLAGLHTTTNREARQFVRFFLAGASEVEIDKAGRILIPNILKEFAKLEKDVVLVGAGTRIEIWDRERYDGATADADVESIADSMENLGLGI